MSINEGWIGFALGPMPKGKAAEKIARRPGD